MIITTQHGKGDKIHIYADNEYRLTVDETFWLSLGIKEKSETDEEKFAELENTVLRRRAFNKAVDLLAAREHSKKEILTKLIQRGYSKEIAEETIEKLSEYGYIDDERFARLFAKELKERKKFGLSRIKQELFRKGIDRETVEIIICETEEDPAEEIRELLMKKYPHFSEDEKNRNRAINGLLRYGYRIQDIKNVINRFDNGGPEYYYIDD